MSKKQEVIHSKIWNEIPEPDNPFAAAVCECSGFDVYGDLLGKISWIQYLYLLFKLEPPTDEQARLLEGAAVAIANPGPRDLSVRAAMNGGVGGSTSAACLMAALAPGAGQYGGAREVYLAMQLWAKCEQELSRWKDALRDYDKEEPAGVWPAMEHAPGFDPPTPPFIAARTLKSRGPGLAIATAEQASLLEGAAVGGSSLNSRYKY